MSALGLGLIAADNYFKEGDARVQRGRESQRFDWEKQRAESEMSTLPDKTEAERSGYQLRGKQNNANIGLVDAQTENAKKKLQLEGTGLDAAHWTVRRWKSAFRVTAPGRTKPNYR